MSYLNKNLNSDVHTLSELSMRQVHAKVDGLCGIAAFYQALSNTLLTPSQLRLHDHGSMRDILVEAVENVPAYVYTSFNNFKKRIKKDDKLLLEKFHKGTHIIYYCQVQPQRWNYKKKL